MTDQPMQPESRSRGYAGLSGRRAHPSRQTAPASDGSFRPPCGRAPLLPGPWAEAKGALIPRLV